MKREKKKNQKKNFKILSKINPNKNSVYQNSFHASDTSLRIATKNYHSSKLSKLREYIKNYSISK